MAIFTLGHLSDLHATPVRSLSFSGRPAKRALGWLSWTLRRRHEHRPEVLDLLLDDLKAADPDHVVVTGDLTNLGTPDEIEAATGWLRRLGDPRGVTLVPGNHDAVHAHPGDPVFDAWGPYMRSDAEAEVPDAGTGGFPSLRFRGPVAIVGLCSAHPTSLLEAVGTLGDAQRAALERLLVELGAAGWCRVVMLHHPPIDAGQAPRRRLRDAEPLRSTLSRVGAELVLHGHTHRTSLERLAGPAGAIPVVGVRSASARGRKPGKRAQYHLYRIEPRGGTQRAPRWRITLDVRDYDPEAGAFRAGERHQLAGAGAG